MADSDDEEEEKKIEEGKEDNDSDIVILDEVSNEGNSTSKDKKSPSAIAAKMKEINVNDEDYPPFATIKYEVEEIEPWDYKTVQVKN